MEATKTTVQITQELLALVNTRRDRTQPGGNRAVGPEADPLVRGLLDELSLSGDGTSSSVDQSDPYFDIDHHDPDLFRRALIKLRDEAGEIPESLAKLFKKLLE